MPQCCHSAATIADAAVPVSRHGMTYVSKEQGICSVEYGNVNTCLVDTNSLEVHAIRLNHIQIANTRNAGAMAQD